MKNLHISNFGSTFAGLLKKHRAAQKTQTALALYLATWMPHI